jgi:hypothetical protein
MRKVLLVALAAIAAAGLSGSASAAYVDETNGSFLAASTGNFTVRFNGSDAGYTDSIGLEVNGVMPTTFFDPNHPSPASVGDVIDLGSVHAGDVLNLILNVHTGSGPDYTVSSNTLDNAGLGSSGIGSLYNHVLLGSALGGKSFSFEDQMFPNSDYDYNDYSVVVCPDEVTQGGGTPLPEPAVWAMMIVGFAGIGFAARNSHRIALTPVA